MKTFLLSLLLFVSIVSADQTQQSVRQSYLKSYDYERMGKYEEAIKVLIPLYKKYPKTYTLNLRFGWLFYLKGNFADAIGHYKKASLLKPYAIDPRLGLANVYLKTQNYSKAIPITLEILKIDYYNFYGNLYYIQALAAQKKYKLAKEVIFKMLSLYPTSVVYLEQLAHIYKAEKSPYFKQTIEDILILDPNNVYAKSLSR